MLMNETTNTPVSHDWSFCELTILSPAYLMFFSVYNTCWKIEWMSEESLTSNLSIASITVRRQVIYTFWWELSCNSSFLKFRNQFNDSRFRNAMLDDAQKPLLNFLLVEYYRKCEINRLRTDLQWIIVFFLMEKSLWNKFNAISWTDSPKLFGRWASFVLNKRN